MLKNSKLIFIYEKSLETTLFLLFLQKMPNWAEKRKLWKKENRSKINYSGFPQP